MSLKKNVLTNMAGQAYISLISIFMLPFYVRYLGTEAYGLVGFFVMLQQWLMLLDFGLTPTLSREMSRCKAGVVSDDSAASMVRSLECFFVCLSVVTCGVFWAGSDWIATSWLNLYEISWREASASIFMMGLITGLRWCSGVYRSGLMGLERYTSLNIIGVCLATLRTIGALLLLKYISNNILSYFYFQVAISALELIVFVVFFYRIFFFRITGCWLNWSKLNSVAGLAGSMAYLSSLWVATSQVDKLLLSHYLSLRSFGVFSIAAMAASGVVILASPLTQALQSRFSMLSAVRDHLAILDLYRRSTQLLSAAVFSLSGLLFLRGDELLLAWTGNAFLAHEASGIIGWYALGNAVVGILGLVFLIQFAAGDTKWHVIGCTAFSIVWLPVVMVSASTYGASGVGVSWFLLNLAFLAAWTPFIHGKFYPDLKWRWLFNDVIGVACTALAAMWGMSWIHIYDGAGLFMKLSFLSIVTLVSMLAGVFFGDFSRKWLTEQVFRVIGCRT